MWRFVTPSGKAPSKERGFFIGRIEQRFTGAGESDRTLARLRDCLAACGFRLVTGLYHGFHTAFNGRCLRLHGTPDGKRRVGLPSVASD